METHCLCVFAAKMCVFIVLSQHRQSYDTSQGCTTKRGLVLLDVADSPSSHKLVRALVNNTSAHELRIRAVIAWQQG
jgi:hypothetical protein